MTTNQGTRTGSVLTIAVPVEDGRLHDHFGGCAQFAMIKADRQQKTILSSTTVAAPPHAPGFFPNWLHKQGVNVVIIGSIGRHALKMFAQHGIEVRPEQPGTLVEELVAAYLNDALTGVPQGCSSRGHRHRHRHGWDAEGCH